MAAPRSLDWKPLLHAAVAAAITLVSTVATDFVATHRVHLTANLLADDVLAAMIVAILVFVYERRRRRYLAEKLNTIFLMNHHIRNALQWIVFSEPSSSEAAEQIREAVARIDWALREVLPGGATALTYTAYPPIKNDKPDAQDQRPS